MNSVGGSVTWNLDVDGSKFTSGLAKARGEAQTFSKTLGGFNFREFSSQASSAFGGVADALGGVLKAGIAIAAGGTFGIGAMAKASWNQVDAVQQAVAGLNRYYKSSTDVAKITEKLIEYAQSDMGVLFNRKDLFNSAQGLAMFGIEADKVSGYVKILSRGMASNRLTWDELDRVVGRVIATGKLGGEEFDMLRKAGYNLSSSLRNTSVDADELFKILDNSIAKDVSQDMTNITPIAIRLESAFRAVGDAFLGVNKTGDKFVKGGLGYQINKAFQLITETLKDPEFKKAIAEIGKNIGDFAVDAIPKIRDGFIWIVKNWKSIQAGIMAIGGAFVFAKGAAIGFSIAASANPIGLIAAVITALVGSLIYLELRFKTVSTALMNLWNVIKPYLLPVLTLLWKVIQEQLIPVFQELWEKHGKEITAFFKILGGGVGILLIAMIVQLVGVLAGLALSLSLIVRGITIVVSWWKIFTAFVGQAGTAVGQFVSRAGGHFARFASLAGQAVARAVMWFGALPARIGGAIGSLYGMLYRAGGEMIAGLVRGIENAWNTAVDYVKSLAQGVKDAFTTTLRIDSPSKVFQGYGVNITEGLIKGIGAGIGKVNTEVNALVSPDLAPSSATSVSNSSSLTNNIGTIIINKDADADKVLAKLTRDDEIMNRGLIPTTNYGARA